MSAILNALMALDQSLDNLESAALQSERKASRLHQQDLFNGLSASANGSRLGIDPAMLAGKLDIAIERVEQMLREG